ncbi:MAG: WecB/TagA/CpsF family glycosyltransferase [Verrucomicrobiales bacterium]|nr:WecB/TagA/CpsF family glycosyltransferase [Verrucomicrobiales bacterium]
MIPAINHKIEENFHLRKGQIHAFLNPYTYLQLRQHQDLISQFDIIHFDGIALCRIYRLFGLKKVARRSFDMTSVARDVFQEASQTDKTVAIVGTQKGVIDEAVSKLEKSFNVRVTLSRDGYFDSEEEIREFQNKILTVNPDILVVGMGAVRQERFLAELKELGWGGTGFTCGGFLHQTADRLEYYPKIFDKMNLRWLYRIWKDPYVIGRYCLDYPKFIYCFTKDYNSWKNSKDNV